MKTLRVLLSFGLLFSLAACKNTAVINDPAEEMVLEDEDATNDDDGRTDDEDENEIDDDDDDDDEDVDAASDARVIEIQVTTWSFSPNSITVAKGEKVTLKLIGGEGIHGFSVPGLGINQTVKAGETVMLDIDTSVAGTFDFRCSIPCGSGHKEMTGSIVITE